MKVDGITKPLIVQLFHGKPCWEQLQARTYDLEDCLELVSKELNHLAAILHVYAGGFNFMK